MGLLPYKSDGGDDCPTFLGVKIRGLVPFSVRKSNLPSEVWWYLLGY